ncbi:MAG: DUF5115 domain-containing protein [Prevotella sp.]|nr:DUF5115 domain-containing protein [Prevotella sp.]
MKKLNIFLSALLGLALAACTENFDPEVGPQHYLPESPLAMDDVSMTKEASAIDIESLIEAGDPIVIGTVSVAEGAMPANTVIKAEVEFSADADYSKSITLPATVDENNQVTVSASDLQDAYFNNITRNPKQVDLNLRTILYTVTNGAAEAIIGKPGENFFAEQTVPFTPQFKVQISPAYYVIGAAGGWSADGARTQKFEHSDADVYDDPVFTIIIDSGGDDCWFAIGDDAALDAVSADDWSQLLGTKGESEDLTGTMDTRTNLGGDHSFHVQNAKKIRITLDMMEYSYTIEPVNIAESYYLIGGPGEWSAESARTMAFSHSDKDVFEDPIFTYTFAGTGGDMWFAFGDGDAIDAVAAGDWSKLFGTKGESTDLSGSFDNRFNLDGDHSFCVDGKAKFYRFQVNMAEKTYTITPLDFDPYVYFIGATDGWANAEQKLALTDDGGIYTGYLYCADPNGWGNEFKFQKVPGDWDSQLNSATFTGGITGDFAAGEDNIKANAGEGVYFVTLDLANLTLNAVKVETMGIIGGFNGWGGDVVMTWNATDYCFEATGAGVTADGWKFRVNADWGINLGGTLDNLVANGDNLSAVGNTIKLYPTRKGADNIYCTVE